MKTRSQQKSSTTSPSGILSTNSHQELHYLKSTTPEHSANRNVLVIGVSVVRHTDSSLTRLDKDRVNVSCLSVARISDISRALKSISPNKYDYEMVVAQVGLNDSGCRTLRTIQRETCQKSPCMSQMLSRLWS